MSEELTRRVDDLRREVAGLQRRCEALEMVVGRQQRRLETLDALALQVRRTHFWDHSAYEVVPDESFVSVDRTEATQLLGALAQVDHWRPWHTSVEHTS